MKKRMRKRMLCLLLTFIMTITNGNVISFAQLISENTIAEPLDGPTEVHEYLAPKNRALNLEEMSDNRAKYESLLDSGYSNYEMPVKFRELFGESYSDEYVREHYAEIFDLVEGEEIDQAFLNVITNYNEDFDLQNSVLKSEQRSLDTFDPNIPEDGVIAPEFVEDEEPFITYPEDLPVIEEEKKDEPILPEIVEPQEPENNLPEIVEPQKPENNLPAIEEDSESVVPEEPEIDLPEEAMPEDSENLDTAEPDKILPDDSSSPEVVETNNTLPQILESKQQELESLSEENAKISNDLENSNINTFENISNDKSILEMEEQPAKENDTMLMSTATNINTLVKVWFTDKTNTSISVNVEFKSGDEANNYLKMYDKGQKKWTTLLGQGQQTAMSRNFTVSGLIPGNTYIFSVGKYDWANKTWQTAYTTIQTRGAKTQTLQISSKTSNSVTFAAYFPSEGIWGNTLRYYDKATKTWVNISGTDLYQTSGMYILKNMAPGVDYNIYIQNYDHLNDKWNDREMVSFQCDLPQENLLSYNRSNIDFKLDKMFTDLLGSSLTDRFLTNTNEGYNTMYNLVNGNLTYSGGRMKLEHTRNLSYDKEGLSGWPIYWQLYDTSPIYNYSYCMDHAINMSQYAVDTTEAPFHEISHNFDNYKWTFEPEALAILKIYYHYSITGQSMVTAGKIPFTGSQYKTYMKSYATRISGNINYDEAMSKNVYSPYSLAYNLGDIADTIGWDKFTQAFTFMYNQPSKNIPTTKIGKLNLFLSKLQDFSGKDVFAMFTEKEKSLYASYFGGEMKYVKVDAEEVGSVIKGVVYKNSVMSPAITSQDLNATMEFNSLEINTANRWLEYQIKVDTVGGTSWLVTSSKVMYENPSYLYNDGNILGARASDEKTWKTLSVSVEEEASKQTLLPANREKLQGKPIIKIALQFKETNDIYYFEGEIPRDIYDGTKSIAYNANTWADTKQELNTSLFWYLGLNTDSLPSGQLTINEAQKGLAYNAAQLYQKLGASAFDQTFAYFKSLTSLPVTPLDRLNVFLTALKEKSGQDVISQFDITALSYYEALFGGKIQYGGNDEQWNLIILKDENGNDIRIFTLDTTDETAKITIRMDDTNKEATKLIISNGRWVVDAQSRASSGNVDYNYWNNKFMNQSENISKNDLLNLIKPHVILKINEIFGETVTAADMSMIERGITDSIQDNLYNGSLLSFLRPKTNVMYARAKMISDAFFVAAYLEASDKSVSSVLPYIGDKEEQALFMSIVSDNDNLGRMPVLVAAIPVMAIAVVAIATAVVIYEVSMDMGKLVSDYLTSVAQVRSNEGSVGVADKLGDIAGGFDNKQCDKARDAMVTYLDKQKQEYEIVSLQFDPKGRGYVLCLSSGSQEAISINGYHVGVLYKGKVYCNIHPTGWPLVDWLNDFVGDGACVITPAKYQALKTVY